MHHRPACSLEPDRGTQQLALSVRFPKCTAMQNPLGVCKCYYVKMGLFSLRRSKIYQSTCVLDHFYEPLVTEWRSYLQSP